MKKTNTRQIEINIPLTERKKKVYGIIVLSLIFSIIYYKQNVYSQKNIIGEYKVKADRWKNKLIDLKRKLCL